MSLKPGEWAEVRRVARQHTDRWEQVGRDIWCLGREIGTMKTPALARYVALVHNAFMPLMQRLYMALRRAKDIAKMEDEGGV